MLDKPQILTAQEAMKLLGIGRKSFKELEKFVRFLRLGRRKMFVWDDLISGIERMKEEPCITSRSTSISRQKSPRTRTITTRDLKSTGSQLESALQQII